MDVKTIEIRDRGTFIPALAVRLGPRDERDRWLCARAGYGRTEGEQSSYVLLILLTDMRASCDPYEWGGARTMPVAHKHLVEHWDSVANGDVVCVEYLTGERETPKVSEQLEGYDA